ncbi:MAG: DUF481 domain-containing protein [Jannaschia sp.]
MTKTFTILAALAMTVALPAVAQNTVTGVRQLDDQISDIDRDARRDLSRGEDSARFGENDVVQGFRGSAALTASGASGNTDTGDLSFAGRLTYGVGSWNHLIGFAGEYGESNGVNNEEEFFAIYEGSRYFTPQFYAYGTGRFEYDSFATDERDAFLGLGLGYRIYNTDQFAWRVQAGPGIRYIEDQNGNSETELAGLASSRFYYGLTDTISLTNDTDILGSDDNTAVVNDFGVNFRVNDTLSTRISYRTDYNSDPLPGLKSTDNTIGVSLVVGF